eukprot:4019398-Lingulodinium_polyedra.AAC.1
MILPPEELRGGHGITICLPNRKTDTSQLRHLIWNGAMQCYNGGLCSPSLLRRRFHRCDSVPAFPTWLFVTCHPGGLDGCTP